MFRKEFKFNYKHHEIRVMNDWVRGIKLYVDGDHRDWDKRFYASQNDVLLSAQIEEGLILEIVMGPTLFTVQIDAYVRQVGQKDKGAHIFSSHGRVSFRDKRAAEAK